jgi:type II secretory pathway predicted ATPase ExeA
MYKVFYGFTKDPFAKDISTQNLFQYNYFKELLSRFAYIKKHRGIMLLTGEPGTGKTTALRYFFSSLNVQSFYPIYIPLSTVGVTDFYRQINQKLNGEPFSVKSRLFKAIQERILDLASNQNRVPVIIIDECHYLRNENFFELQIISNFHMDSFDPCAFILSAQSHLNDRMQRSILRSFNQRINIKYHFNPLGFEESKEFILHNFKSNGVHRDIFTEPAFKAIFKISGGILRTIGKLTIKTLSYGTINKKQNLTEEDVFIASNEL